MMIVHFAAASPRVWNCLIHIRQPDLTLGQFYRQLMTHFCQDFSA